MIYLSTFSEEVWDRLQKIGFIIGLLTSTIALSTYANIPLSDSLTLLSIFSLIVISWTGFDKISRKLDKLDIIENLLGQTLNIKNDPMDDPPEEKKEEKEEPIETTGAGAFGGMVLGGLIGLAFGALGVLIGGIIGAIIGDQLEREKIREEKKKKKSSS